MSCRSILGSYYEDTLTTSAVIRKESTKLYELQSEVPRNLALRDSYILLLVLCMRILLLTREALRSIRIT
jgi:hypothetical protein